MTDEPEHPCGCPASRRIVDPAGHLAFHELAVAQGIPPGRVGERETRLARGTGLGSTPSETSADVTARVSGKRASGALRRASWDD